MAREVSSLHASLLGRLHEEMAGGDAARFAEAAQRLAQEFGSVTATAVGTLWQGDGRAAAVRGASTRASTGPVRCAAGSSSCSI